jgi:hypothetical protein
MDAEVKDDELTQWFSTYGLITAERILGKYQITLPQDTLLAVINKSSSFFHRLIQVPLKNVLNGIILQQAEDYHVYGQKLLIDYVLSASGEAGEDSPGGFTRESLEEERHKVMQLGEDFQQARLAQDALIASTQIQLIKLTSAWRAAFEKTIQSIKATCAKNGSDVKPSTIRKAIHHVLIECDLEKEDKLALVDTMNTVLQSVMNAEIKGQLAVNMSDLINHSIPIQHFSTHFHSQTQDMNRKAKAFRVSFFNTVLKLTELIKALPEYKINAVQDLANKELLHFDRTIGEEQN